MPTNWPSVWKREESHPPWVMAVVVSCLVHLGLLAGYQQFNLGAQPDSAHAPISRVARPLTLVVVMAAAEGDAGDEVVDPEAASIIPVMPDVRTPHAGFETAPPIQPPPAPAPAPRVRASTPPPPPSTPETPAQPPALLPTGAAIPTANGPASEPAPTVAGRDMAASGSDTASGGLADTPGLTADSPAGAMARDQGVPDASAFQSARLARPPNLSAYYPLQARARGITGSSRLELQIDHKGGVAEVRSIAGHPSGIFDAAARRVAHSLRFEPAHRQGAPVASEFTLAIEWKLQP